MKKITLLSAVLLSHWATAETAPSVMQVQRITLEPASTDKILPQLSFEAQQARVAELAKQAEYRILQEEEKRLAAEKLQQAQIRIQQELGTKQLLLSQVVAKIYAENQLMPLWTNPQAVKVFLRDYALFAASGISQKSTASLQQILETPEGFARDILLTDSLLDYLYYNYNVANNANQWLYNIGSYIPKAPDELHINLWLSSVRNQADAQFIENLFPKNHVYQNTVQQLLSMNIDNPNIEQLTATEKPKNAKEKGASAELSFQKLALNAQRLRLIPNFDNGIFVNIPSYQLYYFRDGNLTLQSKVIVGRNDRKTPVMYSKLSNVVVNPPWNVPTSIKNKDLVPKMRKDPSYVDRNGYEIIDSSGNKVDPYTIDWTIYDNPGKNFPYRLRQKAGDDSALGRYKFNMPSSDAIYLHDTPNRGLFNKTNRALSSGCVRVAKSDELATVLLKEAGWTEQRKQNVLNSKKTTSAQIYSNNPVYLYYVTAWVENGKIYTLPDIYRFDSKLPKAVIDWKKVKSVI